MNLIHGNETEARISGCQPDFSGGVAELSSIEEQQATGMSKEPCKALAEELNIGNASCERINTGLLR